MRHSSALLNQVHVRTKTIFYQHFLLGWKLNLSIHHQTNNRFNLDFLVGSIHHVNEIPIDFNQEQFSKAQAHCGSLDKLFERYFDSQFDLLQKIRPKVVGDFDLIRMYHPGHILTESGRDLL